MIKKMVNVLLIAVMLFSELAPYSVLALQPATANKGDIYNPETDSVGDSATVNAKSYTGTYSDGDVEVQKIVSKTDTLGKYKVEFKVRGKKTSETTITKKNVYVVVVLDKSGSMICDSTIDSYAYSTYNEAKEASYDYDWWGNRTYFYGEPTSYKAADNSTIYCSHPKKEVNGSIPASGLLKNKWESAVNGAVNFSSTLF